MGNPIDLLIDDQSDNIDLELSDDSIDVDLELEADQVLNSTDYNDLIHKPKINGVELKNDKSFEELGVESLTNLEIKSIFDRVFGGE